MSPDEMIARMLADDNCDCSQQMCSAFRNGYPIENLRPLLTSPSLKTQGLGAYLAYELEWMVHPFVAELTDLLDSPEAQIRSDAMYALLRCTTPDDLGALGRVILLLDDPSPFVRRGAMRFVQLSERWRLSLGVREAAKLKPDTVFSRFPKYTGRHTYPPISRRMIEHLVADPSPIAQRFGAGLAARPRLVVDTGFLTIAERCEEEECRNIVKWARERSLPTYAVPGRIAPP